MLKVRLLHAAGLLSPALPLVSAGNAHSILTASATACLPVCARPSDGEALAKAASPRLSPVIIDVTDARTITEAAAQVEQALGDVPLVGLVNNAGIGIGGPVEFLQASELRRQMEVNLIGPVLVTQAFMPMLRRSRGRIVFISSVGGKVATPLLGPYCASKFALEGLCDSMRAELKPFGISVSIVEPGGVKTAMVDKARSAADDALRSLPPEGVRYYGSQIEVLRRLIDSQGEAAVTGRRRRESRRACAHCGSAAHAVPGRPRCEADGVVPLAAAGSRLRRIAGDDDAAAREQARRCERKREGVSRTRFGKKSVNP